LSKPNPFGSDKFAQFSQVFGLHRFILHRHLVDHDGTVKSVWFRSFTSEKSSRIPCTPEPVSKRKVRFVLHCTTTDTYCELGLALWFFTAIFNNISVISWWSVLLVQDNESNLV
jgi:hypothetical protein